jgi:hypothetical protein
VLTCRANKTLAATTMTRTPLHAAGALLFLLAGTNHAAIGPDACDD